MLLKLKSRFGMMSPSPSLSPSSSLSHISNSVHYESEEGRPDEELHSKETERNDLNLNNTEDVNNDTVDTSPGPPPNGGLKAWSQVFGGFFLVMNSFGLVQCFGIFQAYYKSTLIPDTSDSAISWIGSIQGFLVISGAILVGRLIDGGHVLALVISGNLACVIGLMMLSLCTKYYQILLSQGLLFGLGCAALFLPTVVTVNTYFSTKKGLATGFVTAGAAVGGVIYPLIASHLIKRVGFPWTARILGFIFLALGAIGVAVIRRRLPSRTRGAFVDWSAFLDADFILFTVSGFFVFLGSYQLIFYIQSYSEIHGLANHISSNIICILSAGSVLGRIVPAAVGDKLGLLNMFVPTIILIALLNFVWIGTTSPGGVIVLALIYGFFSGAGLSLPSATFTSINEDITKLGTRLGMSFFIIGLGILCGSPIAGAILTSENGSYLGMQLFSGCCLVVGLIPMIYLRIAVGRRRGTMKC